MIFIIAKKELDRVFSDFRLLFSTLLFPGILIFSLYALLSNNALISRADTTTTGATSMQMLASILPILVLTFLYNGCSAVTIESIAGEKERGTLMTTLISPVSHTTVIIGKMIGSCTLGILNALSSLIGFILSALITKDFSFDAITVAMSPVEIVLMCVTVLLLTGLIVALLTAISCWSRNTKESTSLTTPILLLMMLIGLMAIQNQSPSVISYMIPVYGNIICIKQMLLLSLSIEGIMLTVVSNILFLGFAIQAITAMFKNEHIMYAK